MLRPDARQRPRRGEERIEAGRAHAAYVPAKRAGVKGWDCPLHRRFGEVWWLFQSPDRPPLPHPDKPLVIHHRRKTTEDLATRIINSGLIRLDPPGIELRVEDFYPSPD